MERSKTKTIRRVGRNVLGLGFWVHALYATQLFRLPENLIPHLPPYVLTILLIVTISYYSLLGEFEWLAIAGDILYVYLWPCIVLYKAIWLSIKSLYKFIRPKLVLRSPGLIAAQVPQRPPIEAQEKSDSKKKPDESRSVLEWVLKPFRDSPSCGRWSHFPVTTNR